MNAQTAETQQQSPPQCAFWVQCKDVLSNIVPTEHYFVWIQPLIGRQEADTLIVDVPNAVFQEFLENTLSAYFSQAMQLACKRLSVTVTELVFRVDSTTKETSHRRNSTKKHHIDTGTGIDSRFTFDNFVVGPSNTFAYSSARALAEKLHDNEHNPLFVCGASGLGKSHLLNAIGNAICTRHKRAKVAVLRSKDFVKQMIRAIRDQKMDEYIGFFEQLDVFMLDDVHVLSGKERTQEEVYGIFERLRAFDGQMVLASDKFPRELENIAPHVKSRMLEAHLVYIDPPEFETRVGLLKEFARRMQVFDALSQDSYEFIAHKMPVGARPLFSLIKTLTLGIRTKGIPTPASVEDVQNLLSRHLHDHKRSMDVDGVQRTVAAYFKIEVQDLIDKSRRRQIVRPRQIAMYLTRECTDLSYPDIGRAFGGRDHATVMSACTRIRDAITNNKDGDVADNIRRIKAILQI